MLKRAIKVLKAHHMYLDEACETFMRVKKAAFKEMTAVYETKLGNLGENDDDLSSKREQLETVGRSGSMRRS